MPAVEKTSRRHMRSGLATHRRIRIIIGTALDVARSQRLSDYDAGYLELAMRRGIPLATKDDALAKAARRVGVSL